MLNEWNAGYYAKTKCIAIFVWHSSTWTSRDGVGLQSWQIKRNWNLKKSQVTSPNLTSLFHLRCFLRKNSFLSREDKIYCLELFNHIQRDGLYIYSL